MGAADCVNAPGPAAAAVVLLVLLLWPEMLLGVWSA
jgi:hypothetical protein